MKYYKSIDTVTVYSYYKASEDIRYLLKGIDYDELPEISEKERAILIEVFEELQNQLSDLESSKINVKEEIRNSVARLTIKHQEISNHLDIMRCRYIPGLDVYYDFKQNESELKKLGYELKYSDTNELIEQIKLKHKRLEGLKNRIEEKKQKLNQEQTTETRLEDIIAIIADVIGVNVDKFTCTMDVFKGLIKRVDNKVKAQSKNGKNSR